MLVTRVRSDEVERAYGRGRTQVVGGDDNAILELNGEDGGSSDSGRLRMCYGVLSLKVRRIVCAIDIVSGLSTSEHACCETAHERLTRPQP